MIPRHLDTMAANLILVSEKVKEAAAGRIPLPEVVELFLTNFCNFACPFCRCAAYHGDPSQYFEPDVLWRLLDELAAAGVSRIEFGGGGEPLIHPRIGDILERMRRLSFRFGLITNGWRLTESPELIEPLVECADWVRFSIDAVSDDAYRVVHGRPLAAFQPLRAMVASLVRRAAARRAVAPAPRIGIKLIVQRPNQHQILTAVDEALNLGVDYLQFKWLDGHPWSIPSEERPVLSATLEERLRDIPDRLTVDVLPGYETRKTYERCRMSILHPVIDWDGAVYFCAFFHHRKERHSIGSVAAAPFFELWNAPRHLELRAKVDPAECVANCPMNRYNPIVDYILKEEFRFRYI